MSLFQSLNVGVSGIRAQGNVLNIISDNLANVNTVGYKKSASLFASLVGNDLTTGYSPGGATGGYRALNSAQGIISRTDNATDIAISGNGFFAVRGETATSSVFRYTRAGAFSPNKDGDFVNGAGYFLQGWLLNNGSLPAALSGGGIDAATATAAMQTVNVQNLTDTPIPTTAIEILANLKASQTPLAHSGVAIASNLDPSTLAVATGSVSVFANLDPTQAVYSGTPAYAATTTGQNMASSGVVPDFFRTVSVIDNTGTLHNVTAGFLKTAADTWSVEIYVQPAADVTQTDGQLATGTITFNADGSLGSVSAGIAGALAPDWNNVGGPTALTFNFGTIDGTDGLTQSTSSGFSGSMLAAPDYDPTDSTRNMASGAITASYSQNVTVTDDAGTPRTLRVAYLKIAPDRWAVEVYAVPATDVAEPDGLVAYGTANFNSNGTLSSISNSLDSPVAVSWNGNAPGNQVSFDWRSSGTSAGLTQEVGANASAFTATQNYDPTNITINMASGGVAPSYDSEVSVVDPDGNLHRLKVSYLKNGTNSWAVEIYPVNASEITATNPQIAAGNITFNGDGSLASVSASLLAPIAVEWQPVAPATAPTTNTLTLGWGTVGGTDGLTQLDKDYGSSFSQDGFQPGNLTGVEVTTDGFVVGIYDNGTSKKLYQLPLAQFIEPNKLESISGNVFAESDDSGVVTFSLVNQNGAGELVSGALENSNVETEAQLVDMIVAQKSYQANTKVISTTDAMLQTMTQAV